MGSNPEKPNPTPNPTQSTPDSKPNSKPNSSSLPKTETISSFIIPGSADAAAFVTPEIVDKFKAFLDAFDKANNSWYQAYKGLRCIDRPAFSTAGKEAVVAVNSHKVVKLPTAPVFQYDVSHDIQFQLFAVFLTHGSIVGHHRKWCGEARRHSRRLELQDGAIEVSSWYLVRW